MDASQLALELEALRRDYNQYRVEMASRLNDLERRLEIAEAALARAGDYGADPPLPPLPGPPHTSPGFRSGAGLAEHRRHARPPPPAIYTAPVPSIAFTPSSHPATPYGYPQQTPRFGERPPKKMGSADNAGYLPYVIEKIAAAAQKGAMSDDRTCACGRPVYDMKCFRECHFDWCIRHQRPVVQGHQTCTGRDHHNCQPIHWEKHPDWEMIVKKFFDSGYLGSKEVKDLYEVLLPLEIYPEKYQGGWYVG